MQDPIINAFTVGSENPIVVLNTKTVECLTEAELRFILGHEVGHIKSQHSLYHWIARFILPYIGDTLGKATFGIGKIFTAPLQLALLSWSRKSELTADRAGLLACQNRTAALYL
jgi:Zn-dependent protease with chaperone function